MKEQESTTQNKPRNNGMKWLKLGLDKNPSFDQVYFLVDEKEIGQGEHAYDVGKLHSITSVAGGAEYSFNIGWDKHAEQPNIASNFSHFCLPKPPVE